MTTQISATPIEARSQLGSQLLVVALGLATSALALFGVFMLSVFTEDTYVMGWYWGYVIPIGAILVGAVASSGYGLGSWWSGVKISGVLLMGIMALQVGAYFVGQYIEFSSMGLAYEDGTPVDFISYFQWATTSFGWIQDDGSMGPALGAWGYGLKALEVAGFAIGSLIAPAALRSVSYCDTCLRYMRKQGEVMLPASVQARKIKKKDAEGKETYERAQQEALEVGTAVGGNLAELAAAGDAEGFSSVAAEYIPIRKEVSKLPIRLLLSLSSCPNCQAGELKASVITGQGQEQNIQETGRGPLRQGFATEVRLS